jgi:hypothetical protein
MRCYLLLRNNVESGPFTFDEIVTQALKPTDLIWIEGQSVMWQHPEEIPKLQPHVEAQHSQAETGSAQNPTAGTSKKVYVALPQPHFQASPLRNETQVEPVLETRFSQPLETLQEAYYRHRRHTPFSVAKTFSKPHAAVWLLTVFFGLLLSAFLIKKIVDVLGEYKLETPSALPVAGKEDLKTAHEETFYQNALTTELVPVDTITLKPVKKAPAKVNFKKLVRLEANDYQVGLFGGIKNLRLLLTNKSGFVLDKVKIELQYLKPNGAVLNTEHLAMNAVSPKSSKSLAVSSKNRGVKVICRITDIQSKQNTGALVNL